MKFLIAFHECSPNQSFSERRSIERRSERALVESERERERRSKLINERWAWAHPKITERERKLALIFALKIEPFSPFWDR